MLTHPEQLALLRADLSCPVSDIEWKTGVATPGPLRLPITWDQP